MIIIIGNSSLLKENDTIVQSIIYGHSECDTLVINGTKDMIDKSFLNTEAFNIFWQRLAQTVSTLSLKFIGQHIDVGGLRTLHEEEKTVLNFILSNFFVNNVGPQIVIVDCLAIDYDMRQKFKVKKMQISFALLQILSCCKSLKKLVFYCNIPFEVNIINDLFSGINYNFLDMDDVVFDCEPIPQWTDYRSYYWVVRQIEMEFIATDKVRSVLIKPLSIGEEISNILVGCEPNCSANHQMLQSQSVLEFQFMSLTKCRKYYRTCFESFPSITHLDARQSKNSFIFELMSTKLGQLKHCIFSYYGPCLKESNLPESFPNMESIDAVFGELNHEVFKKFVKSCPNLKQLSVIVYGGITDDVCVKIITENLKNLEYLSIECGDSKSTTHGLHLIGIGLTELKELHVNCGESKENLDQLYNKLPELQILYNKKQVYERNNQEKGQQRKSTNSSISNGTHINDFPNEILALIFSCLKNGDQRGCREVCMRWFEIISSSWNTDRTLDLRGSYLSWKTRPVTCLINSKFKYNKILFNAQIKYTEGDNLAKFWKKIGNDVQEIYIEDHNSHFKNALRTGLKVQHLPKLKRLSLNDFGSCEELADMEEWKLLLKRIKTLTFYRALYVSYCDFDRSYVEMSNLIELQLFPSGSDYEVILQLLNQINCPNIQTLFVMPTIVIVEIDRLFSAKLKFYQLKDLFVVKNQLWSASDFVLIMKNCPILKCLGIGEGTNDSSQNLNCQQIAKLMFDELPLLGDISFVLFLVRSRISRQRKSYARTGVKSFTKSERRNNLFDQFDTLCSSIS